MWLFLGCLRVHLRKCQKDAEIVLIISHCVLCCVALSASLHVTFWSRFGYFCHLFFLFVSLKLFLYLLNHYRSISLLNLYYPSIDP